MDEQQSGVPANHQVVVSADQIQKRVRDIARQVSNDFRGKVVYAVGLLEDGFIFMADLVRQLEVPVICQFVKPQFKQVQHGDTLTMEIFFSPEVDVRDGDVLLVQAILQSGVTTEFMMRNLIGRGAKSVKLATLLDRQTGRRVLLQPDYFGFLVDEHYVFGYGMGAPKMGRNLPYVATTRETGPLHRSVF